MIKFGLFKIKRVLIKEALWEILQEERQNESTESQALGWIKGIIMQWL